MFSFEFDQLFFHIRDSKQNNSPNRVVLSKLLVWGGGGSFVICTTPNYHFTKNEIVVQQKLNNLHGLLVKLDEVVSNQAKGSNNLETRCECDLVVEQTKYHNQRANNKT